MAPRRRRHRSESGLTLIEMQVTIALMAVAVVGLLGGVANIEKNAQVTTDQSTLEVTMRQITDYLRAPYNGDAANSTAYVFCAATYTVPASIAGKAVLAPSGPLSSAVVTVAVASSATRVGASAPFPIEDCTTHQFAPQQACTAASCDWGVQRLTVKITSTTGRSLTRVIYKGMST